MSFPVKIHPRAVAAALLLALLCACGGGEASVAADVTAEELALAVLDSQEAAEGLTALEGEERDFFLTELCGVAAAQWTDAAVYAASGVDAREVVVLCLAEGADGEAVAAGLEERRQARMADFFGYSPEQYALLEEGAVLEEGGYVALLACPDMTAAREAFAACLSGETDAASNAEEKSASSGVPPLQYAYEEGEYEATVRDANGYVPFNPPNEFDMTLYDTSAIRAAWASGDDSALGEKDRAILERCREIFEACVTEDMTDFEKELALHDYLVEWGEYDQTVHDARTPQGLPDNCNPYGMLVEGYGICLGYATSFQLLMDLAGIECVTVVGAAYRSSQDHGWNLVRLEGEWYCVDPTWNDPSGMTAENAHIFRHRYFNVTSDFLRDTDHQWDYETVPEATADRFFWNGSGPLPQ